METREVVGLVRIVRSLVQAGVVSVGLSGSISLLLGCGCGVGVPKEWPGPSLQTALAPLATALHTCCASRGLAQAGQEWTGRPLAQ